MFNFLFDGKIGEILAPVTGTSQLYLAIQHHRNSEVQSLINAQTGYSLSNSIENLRLYDDVAIFTDLIELITTTEKNEKMKVFRNATKKYPYLNQLI